MQESNNPKPIGLLAMTRSFKKIRRATFNTLKKEFQTSIKINCVTCRNKYEVGIEATNKYLLTVHCLFCGQRIIL